MNKNNLIVAGALILFLLTMGFVGGWNAHKTFKPCPTITVDTVTVQDPYWHHIADSLAGLPPKEKVKWLPQDTLFVPGDTVLADVDTAAILKDYFSVYKYEWNKNTDTLNINLQTTVTKNQPISYKLNYKFNIPFTTIENNIDNSVTYSKYLYLGIDIPIKNFNYIEVEALYAFPKGYVGVGYEPEIKSFSAKAGVTLFKFNDKR